VVRQLIRSGIPLTLGVGRDPHVFFPIWRIFPVTRNARADDLLVQISTYLEEVSSAISGEAATGRQVHRAMRHGVSGMARLNALTTFYAPAPRRCGRHAHERCQHAGRRRTAANPHQDGPIAASALVGMVGSSSRLSYPALGDGRNVAPALKASTSSWNHHLHQRQHLRQARLTYRAAIKRFQVKGRKDRVHDL